MSLTVDETAQANAQMTPTGQTKLLWIIQYLSKQFYWNAVFYNGMNKFKFSFNDINNQIWSFYGNAWCDPNTGLQFDANLFWNKINPDDILKNIHLIPADYIQSIEAAIISENYGKDLKPVHWTTFDVVMAMFNNQAYLSDFLTAINFPSQQSYIDFMNKYSTDIYELLKVKQLGILAFGGYDNWMKAVNMIVWGVEQHSEGFGAYLRNQNGGMSNAEFAMFNFWQPAWYKEILFNKPIDGLTLDEIASAKAGHVVIGAGTEAVIKVTIGLFVSAITLGAGTPTLLAELGTLGGDVGSLIATYNATQTSIQTSTTKDATVTANYIATHAPIQVSQPAQVNSGLIPIAVGIVSILLFGGH